MMTMMTTMMIKTKMMTITVKMMMKTMTLLKSPGNLAHPIPKKYDDNEDDIKDDDNNCDDENNDNNITWEPCPPYPPSPQAQNHLPKAKARRCSTPGKESTP